MSIFANSKANLAGLAPLYGTTFLSAAWSMVIPTIPVIAQSFGVSGGGAAQIITAFAVGKMAGTLIGGFLFDRRGTRPGLVQTPAIATIAALGAVAAPWFGGLLAMALILGATDTLGAVAREMAAIDQAQANQRGRIISSLHGTYTIGSALCPYVGGWLTEQFDYRAAFMGYAVISAVSTLLGRKVPSLTVNAHSKVESPVVATAARQGSRWATLKGHALGVVSLYREIRPELRPTYAAIVVATLGNQSQRIVIQSILPLYASFFLHLTPSQIGLLFTLSGVVVFAMMIPAGFVMDRIGRKWCTVPSTGVPALAFILIPMTTSFFELALLIAFTGIAQGLSLGSLATSTYDVVPAHARARLQAMRRVVAELGSGAAPLIAGFLANQYNPGVPFLVYAPLLLLSAILLAVFGRETLEK